MQYPEMNLYPIETLSLKYKSSGFHFYFNQNPYIPFIISKTPYRPIHE